MGNDLSIEGSPPLNTSNYELPSHKNPSVVPQGLTFGDTLDRTASEPTMPGYRLPLSKQQRDAWQEQEPIAYREWKNQQNKKTASSRRRPRRKPARHIHDPPAADRRVMGTNVEHDMARPLTVKRDVAEAGIDAQAPTAVLSGMIQILRDDELVDEEKQQQLEEALEAASQMGRQPLKELQNSQQPRAIVDRTSTTLIARPCVKNSTIYFKAPIKMQNVLNRRASLDDKSDKANVDQRLPALFNVLRDHVRDEDDEVEQDDGEEEEEEEGDDFGQILIDRLQETLDKSVEMDEDEGYNDNENELEQNEVGENDDDDEVDDDHQVEEQVEGWTNEQGEQTLVRAHDSLAALAQVANDEGHDVAFKDVPMEKRPKDDADLPKNRSTGSSKRQKTLVYGEQANLTEMLSTQKTTAPPSSTLARSRSTKAALPKGDWPHLRSAKTFSGFSLVEQTQTLRDWMSDIEGYVESIQAGAIPAAKVLAFFQRVNFHLNSVTETLDDIALGNERLTAHHAIVQEEMRKADLEKREMGELLGRFTLPSVE
ncbi:hypothetical protein LTS07_003617 [Exophiala sideris]|uniref:Uncharacterized protein n=1 Tax=Exophiala sideris TaxID=1016849 RepID=A0ABR0JHH0_9EURO|nr:hypothetical protein LTS07_003617 [Exophiala sideris]KAK5042187.1 hypothetical protein LTR13_001993 [Exophiala sideris]KAK5063859.1 hypothetical protein LTR69_003625 [Exophiala sideris]KAK5185455.1 hypothetical protein LTR44_002444 [Eurotiomycetes sp. CCFEE 6388]